MITKKTSVSEFEAHSSTDIRAVDYREVVLELISHGKKVAVVRSAAVKEASPDLGTWIGSGKGTVTFQAGYTPDAPAWDASDWDD